MKKLNLLLVLAACFLALGVNAQEMEEKSEDTFYADFYVVQDKPMQFKLSYNHPVSDRLMVRIIDEEKNILFAEKTLVYKKYLKYFDLSTFADGKYTFELTDGDKKVGHSFMVTTETKRIVTARVKEENIMTGL